MYFFGMCCILYFIKLSSGQGLCLNSVQKHFFMKEDRFLYLCEVLIKFKTSCQITKLAAGTTANTTRDHG